MRPIWGVWQTSRVFTPIFHSLGQQTKYDDGFGQIFGKYLTNIWLKPKACTIKSPVMGRRCRNGMNVPFYTTDGDQKQIKPSSRGKKTKRNMNVSQRLEEDVIFFRNCFVLMLPKQKTTRGPNPKINRSAALVKRARMYIACPPCDAMRFLDVCAESC